MKTCNTCKWFVRRTCHLNPPVRLPRRFASEATPEARIRDEQLLWGWPTVSPDDGCAQHCEKVIPREQTLGPISRGLIVAVIRCLNKHYNDSLNALYAAQRMDMGVPLAFNKAHFETKKVLESLCALIGIDLEYLDKWLSPEEEETPAWLEDELEKNNAPVVTFTSARDVGYTTNGHGNFVATLGSGSIRPTRDA